MSELKQAAGQFSRISIHGVGAGDGTDEGDGEGTIVGEHSGGEPLGDKLNIG